MKKSIALWVLLIFCFSAVGQNTIGLPQILNFNNNTFQGGTQTWDIKQDNSGRMYFANNEGLIVFDGSYWRIYPQPNRTILRSIGLAGNRIYAGGQDEIGYYAPDLNGVLKYSSLKSLIPEQFNKFTDIWDIEVFRGAVFFRTWDRIFQYRGQAIRTYEAVTGWQFLKQTGAAQTALIESLFLVPADA